MILIYGIKTTTLDDLLEGVGRPASIIDYVKANYDYVLNRSRDCAYTVNSPISMGPRVLDFTFIPVDVIEEIILVDRLKEAIADACKTSINLYDLQQLKNLLSFSEEKLENLIDSYIDGDKIDNAMCVLIVTNVKHSAVDICVTSPEHVISNMQKEIEYKCCKCGFTEMVDGYEDFAPENMKYKLVNKDIEYYCLGCAEKEDVSTYVGDSLSH